MEIDENSLKLTRLLMPYMMNQLERVQRKEVRFVHYTSAETALKILQNQCIWLRNSQLMNDFSEVAYGLQRVADAYNDQSGVGGRFKSVLESIENGLAKKFEIAFNELRRHLETDTFLLSVSEHLGGDEDRFGRLSMWRAYGGANVGVALVLNSGAFTRPSDAFSAYSSPVFYADETQFKAQFDTMVDGLKGNMQFLQQFPTETIMSGLVEAFRFAALSTKHPGFAEEREWRVIYSPTLNSSDKLIPEIVTISGEPQKIYKIPMTNFPEQGFTGATIPELFDRIIIGPTENPWPIMDAFAETLISSGIDEPWTRIVRSDIPIRR